MKKTLYSAIFIILLFGAFLHQVAGAGSSSAYALSDQEIDNILAPIALYPDPLLAVMLPASTYPMEIADADAWLKRNGTTAGLEGQNWDESVQAVAYYPDILKMMAWNLEWTASLGDAFLSQSEDVTKSIQRLRWQARKAGNLASNDKQQVVIDGDNIKIIPAQPEYMYVPHYDATAVYERSWGPVSPPFITYGFGLAIGGWLCLDFDWHSHHVIYHGWNRPGWVNHARPYVQVPNIYINRSRPFIHQTWKHDMSHGDPEQLRTSQPSRFSKGRFAQTPESRGRQTTLTKSTGVIFGPRGDTNSLSNRGRQSLNTINQPKTPPAAVTVSKQSPLPIYSGGGGSARPLPTGENMRPAKTPSVTYGGYRSGNEAKAQSIRGQSSRQSSGKTGSSSAPASRESAHSSSDPSGGRRGK